MLPFELTKDLALSGELWSVFYEYFNRNWPCYKGFLLYLPDIKLANTTLSGLENDLVGLKLFCFKKTSIISSQNIPD